LALAYAAFHPHGAGKAKVPAGVALIVASIVFVSIGLWRAMFFGLMPDPELVEDLRVCGLYILAGALRSLAPAAWSVSMRHPRWVIAFVAAPVVLVGGAVLTEPISLIRQWSCICSLSPGCGGPLLGIAAPGLPVVGVGKPTWR
jgi:hypothetical protein